jgi:hypothetical protein
MQTTWDNNCSLKDWVVNNLKQHSDLDSLKSGIYSEVWEPGDDGLHDEVSVVKFVGCALGCTLVPFSASKTEVNNISAGVRREHGEWYLAVAHRYSLPNWLTRLEEAVFEATSRTEGFAKGFSKEWPLRFVEAIPVGVSFSEIEKRILEPAQLFVDTWLKENSEYGYSFNVITNCVELQRDDEAWLSVDPDVAEMTGEKVIELLKGYSLEIPDPCETKQDNIVDNLVTV